MKLKMRTWTCVLHCRTVDCASGSGNLGEGFLVFILLLDASDLLGARCLGCEQLLALGARRGQRPGLGGKKVPVCRCNSSSLKLLSPFFVFAGCCRT